MLRSATLAELEIRHDEYGRPLPGFQVGKAAALLDWRHRREQHAFRRLCDRLYLSRWRTTDAGKRKLARDRERRLKRRRSSREANPTRTVRCRGCGVEFQVPIRPGRPPEWCSCNCRARSLYAAGREVRQRQSCSCCGLSGHNRRTCPRSRAADAQAGGVA